MAYNLTEGQAVPEDYILLARTHAEQRIVTGGLRLANLLYDLFAPPPPN